MNLEGEIFLALVDELEAAENRDHVRRMHRQLRDTSDPFSLPERNFIGIFRLTRELARELVDEMTIYYPERERCTGIPIFIRILAALQLLGQGSYQKCIGQNFNFGLSQASISRCLSAFCDILVAHFTNAWIKFPAQEVERRSIKAEYMRKFNFPGVIGCIDCTQIAIHAPPAEHPEHPALAFYNRKGFYSLNTQIICDSNLKILAVNARYPGSVHDSAVWKQSNVRRHLVQEFQAGHQSAWLLGDSGYGLEPWLMTPVINAEADTPEFRYSQAHCSARNTVERTIGVVKNIFRCLLKERVLHYSPHKSASIIYTCCILYNMRLARGMLLIDGEDEIIEQNDALVIQENDAVILTAARRTRINLIRNHFV